MSPLHNWASSRAWLVQIFYLFVGLCICQALACVHMARFNASLLARVQDASATYRFFVPGIAVLEGAAGPKTVFFSALFFTLSIGIGISLLSLLTTFLAKSYIRSLKVCFWCVCGVWVFLLYQINANGFSLFASACLVAVPLTIRGLDKKLSAVIAWKGPGRSGLFHAAALVLMITIWVGSSNQQSFTRVRDRLLLGHSLGETVVRFYYRYSYFAAASIESHVQKRVRTWIPEPALEESDLNEFQAILKDHSYVLVRDRTNADLILHLDEDRGLTLQTPHSAVQAIPFNEFKKNPTYFLLQFSELSDCYAFLRLLISLSLFIGLPVTGYLFLHGGLRLAAEMFASQQIASLTATAVTLVTGALLLVVVSSSPDASGSGFELHKRLNAGGRSERVAAYEYLFRQQQDISRYMDPDILLTSTYIPDRLWLARLLVNSRHQEGIKTLLLMVDDSVPSVSCQAMRSLSERKVVSAVRKLRTVLETTRSWYLQDCAYQSLIGIK